MLVQPRACLRLFEAAGLFSSILHICRSNVESLFLQEHYFSTLLAYHGLDEVIALACIQVEPTIFSRVSADLHSFSQETDCMGELTHTFWYLSSLPCCLSGVQIQGQTASVIFQRLQSVCGKLLPIAGVRGVLEMNACIPKLIRATKLLYIC